MNGAQIAEMFRQLEALDLNELSETELLGLHEHLIGWQSRIETLSNEVAARRAERWWQQMPREEARTIRLLLKGARLTPAVLRRAPELTHLILLIDIADPNVVRLWAEMTPKVRAERIEDLRAALSLTDVRRTTSEWEDQKESAILAYDVLGLTSSATWAEVRRAYRELSTEHHPDRGGDATLFKALHKAYKLLEQRYL